MPEGASRLAEDGKLTDSSKRAGLTPLLRSVSSELSVLVGALRQWPQRPVFREIIRHVIYRSGARVARRRKQAFEDRERRRAVRRSACESRALSLMASGDYAGALNEWDSIVPGHSSARAIDSPFAAAWRLVCSWLVDGGGFRQEMEQAGANVAGSGVSAETVVCSAIVGGHDVSWPVAEVISGASYVRFTDDPDLETWGIWSNRPLEFYGGTPVRSARWVKTHPHMLFPTARWVVWLDGNVIPVEGFRALLERFQASGRALAAIPHPRRSTTEGEVQACIKQGKDNPAVLREVLKRLGPDPGVGLWETNVMFFDLHHPELEGLLCRWWSLIEGGSHRDEVSLPYVIAESAPDGQRVLLSGPPTCMVDRFLVVPRDENTFAAAARELSARFPAQYSRAAHKIHLSRGSPTHWGVDVVVPVHNALKWVGPCLNSVDEARRQGLDRIVIVDDGSDTQTRNFLSQFQSGRDRPSSGPWRRDGRGLGR